MFIDKKTTLFIGMCLVAQSLVAQNMPFRVGPCIAGSPACYCMQANSFLSFAVAHHGAKVNAVSWCCFPATNAIGNPCIHLAIAGDPVPGTFPEGTLSYVCIRIYELDLVALTFTELDSYNINAAIQGANSEPPVVNALDWCCTTDNAYSLIAGGSNLATYGGFSGKCCRCGSLCV